MHYYPIVVLFVNNSILLQLDKFTLALLEKVKKPTETLDHTLERVLKKYDESSEKELDPSQESRPNL